MLKTLEAVIAAQPKHPGAHHYYIHAIEASNDPDRALKSADALGSLMPSAGHMVHMPAHIYLRVGRYADAAEANVRAIAADEDYLAQCQAQGLYPITLLPAQPALPVGGRDARRPEGRRRRGGAPGRREGAASSCRRRRRGRRTFPVTPWLAYVRFGLWTEMLTAPAPPATDPYATGIWHYGRGVAFVARRQLDRAEAEVRALDVDHGPRSVQDDAEGFAAADEPADCVAHRQG